MEGKENLGPRVPEKQTQTASVPDNSSMLKAQTRLAVTLLFKGYLVLLEDLATEHDDAMNRLEDNLPQNLKPYVAVADYWSDAKMDSMRRKILGSGNDLIREIEGVIDSLKIK